MSEPNTPAMPGSAGWVARAMRLVSRRPYTAALLATTLVALPTLAFGFFIDDYFLMLTLDGKTPFHTTFDLFQFSPGTPEANAPFQADGAMPWWSLPELKIHFMRPLSCALMALDRFSFGEHAVFYHLHTLLWYLLLCGGVAALYRRALPGYVGALALLLYGIDEGHWLPVGWWCNRNAIVSVAPVIWGIVAHLRWREDHWRPGLPLSLAGLALGLAGGETAIGGLGFLLAYELFGRSGALRGRFAALVPSFVVGIVYLLIYKYMGYGVHGSGVYIDPVGEFGAYLQQAPLRIVLLLGTMFLNVPAEPATLIESTVLPLLGVGLVALAGMVWVLYRAWPSLARDTRRSVLWLAAAGVFSLPPILATFPSGRLLMMPSIAGAALLAVVIQAAWRSWRQRGNRLDKALVLLLVFLHILVPPLLWAGLTVGVRHLDQRSREVMAWEKVDGQSVDGRAVIVVCAYDPITTVYAKLLRVYLELPVPVSWHTLSAALADHQLTRINEHQLELAVTDGELLANPVEHLIRSAAYPIRPGEHFNVGVFDVEVLECGAHGPKRMRFTFDKPLDDPHYCWLTWRDGRHHVLELPAVGESLALPRQPGLIEPAVLFAPSETSMP